MKIYDAALINKTCVFDSAEFANPEKIINWASGRGGGYTLQVGVVGVESPGLSFGTYNGKKWSRFTPWDGWKDLSKKDVMKMISEM